MSTAMKTLHAIGIDFGGTTIKSGLVCDGRIIQRGTMIETRRCGGPDEIVDALVSIVDELRPDAPSVTALGIGLPRVVDSANVFVHELTNVPGWEDVPLRELLRKRTGLPVTIENDANAMACLLYTSPSPRDS